MSRPLIAWIIGILGLVAYLALVLRVGDWVLAQHWAVQIPYFVLAGTLWAWPVRALMYWGAGRTPPPRRRRR
ncbi:DUF2842 domain-containing protein [Pseudoroseomonas cervicalis]|uniref:DUF2842 domain-containing protein n=1 Tax=Teichococcus cervicalis TaxID=204525 RepID=UPI002784D1C0|nr:DUF2842 domain-containing protein [Pseudoroseomonas cervicalis]MDQ1080047.1 hypothetical protein [Pseudoroseomonas cervicalis]